MAKSENVDHDSNPQLGVAEAKRAAAHDAVSETATPDVARLHERQNPTAAQKRAAAKREQADGDAEQAKRSAPAERRTTPAKATTGKAGS